MFHGNIPGNIQSQGSLTHGRTGGQDNQIALLQAAQFVVQIAIAGWHAAQFSFFAVQLVQPVNTNLSAEEQGAIEKLQRGYHNMRAELGKVIVGQERVIEELLIALFCRGHAMLEGVPGLAKTLLISTLSKTLGLSFNRIQFTPDLMPSDITGTEVIEEDKTTGGRAMRSHGVKANEGK